MEMQKVKEILVDKLPIIGFLIYITGLTYFVVGQDQEILHFIVLGGLSSLAGFILFVYGNMLDEGEE